MSHRFDLENGFYSIKRRLGKRSKRTDCERLTTDVRLKQRRENNIQILHVLMK